MPETDAAQWLQMHGTHTVRTFGVTLDGVVVGKHVARKKFLKAVDGGVALSDFIYGIDLGGTPMIGWWGAWRTPFIGDLHQRPDPNTLIAVPWQPGFAECMVDHVDLE